ncbi:hypothetical protein FHG87_020555 [Trinorchestia longiramus]|nr:hypothetical protein FHG87_020555 [Trinorchestia longiramus]
MAMAIYVKSPRMPSVAIFLATALDPSELFSSRNIPFYSRTPIRICHDDSSSSSSSSSMLQQQRTATCNKYLPVVEMRLHLPDNSVHTRAWSCQVSCVWGCCCMSISCVTTLSRAWT